MDQLVRNMIKLCDLNVRQAVQLVTYNPAKIQRLEDQIGILAENKKADITVFDSDINIKMTVVDGRVLFGSV